MGSSPIGGIMILQHDDKNFQWVARYPGNVEVRVDYIPIVRNYEKSTGELFVFDNSFKNYVLLLVQGILNFALEKSK